MCSKGGVRASSGNLPRTRAWLPPWLLLLLAAAAWTPLPSRAQLEMDMLGGLVLLDAGAEGEELGGGGGGSELEASMHSSLLHDLQEAPESHRATEARETATPTAFPDSSAVVGRVFQIKVPNKMEDVYLGDIVKVSRR